MLVKVLFLCLEITQIIFFLIKADMIRHLKDHNARLSEKLMILNAQLHARSRSGAGN